jgi:hypothetical protein
LGDDPDLRRGVVAIGLRLGIVALLFGHLIRLEKVG